MFKFKVAAYICILIDIIIKGYEKYKVETNISIKRNIYAVPLHSSFSHHFEIHLMD